MRNPSPPNMTAVVEQVQRDADVPGIIVAFARGDDDPQQLCVGTDAHGRPIAPDSLIPVASITKLATALAVLRLAEQGRLNLDDPLSVHLPGAAAAHPGATIRSLLCHTSGLPAEYPESWAPYGTEIDWPAKERAALRTPLEVPPGSRVDYSGVGYLLLGLVVERRSGKAVADALHELVLAPLGMEAYLGVEPPRPPMAIADVAGSESGTDIEAFTRCSGDQFPTRPAGF